MKRKFIITATVSYAVKAEPTRRLSGYSPTPRALTLLDSSSGRDIEAATPIPSRSATR